MYEQKLLTVEDHFLLTSVGLVVTPDFSIPNKGSWVDFSSTAKIVDPIGNETEQEMRVSLWHFNIRDPNVRLDKCWRVVVNFPKAAKEQIPLGSQIFVSRSDYARITGERDSPDTSVTD